MFPIFINEATTVSEIDLGITLKSCFVKQISYFTVALTSIPSAITFLRTYHCQWKRVRREMKRIKNNHKIYSLSKLACKRNFASSISLRSPYSNFALFDDLFDHVVTVD